MITAVKKIKKRRIIENIFFPILLGIIFLGIAGFLIVTNWKINQKRAELQERRDVLKREIQILEEKVSNLRAGIVQTETDDFQTEKLYEEGYFPEGAVPIVVLPPEQETTEKEEKAEEKNPWQNFLDPVRNLFK